MDDVGVVAPKACGLMWVGPTIKGVARHGTVFADGELPPGVRCALRDFPAGRILLVPLEGADKALADVRSGKGAVSMVSVRMMRMYSKR